MEKGKRNVTIITEDTINNSPFLRMEPDRESATYRAMENKFIETLCKFAIESYGKYKYAKFDYKRYAAEVFAVAKRCIRSYLIDEGPFSNYFFKSLNNACASEIGKQERAKTNGGVHISDNEFRITKLFKEYLDKERIDILYYNDAVEFAEKYGITVENTFRIYNYLKAVKSINNTSEDGSTYVTVSDKSADVSADLYDTERTKSLLEQIEEVFSKKQERSKPLLSRLLTRNVAGSLCESRDLLETAEKLSFFNREYFDRIIKQTALPNNKDIADELGTSEQNLSRAYGKFKEELTALIQQP